MKLAHRDLGGGGRPALVVLHGLYGSSRNWATAGRRLADRFAVVAVDLRNHGASPHDPDCSYQALAGDVVELLDELELERLTLMGHSLGGKVAMRVACVAPDRIERLYVLDIAPKQYRRDPSLLDALLSVDLAGLSRRSEVDDRLRESIPDDPTRQFLLTNLERCNDGFRWQANLAGLRAGFDDIARSPLRPGDRYPGPTHFIAGGRSAYLSSSDIEAAREHFPSATLDVLAESGHNVHVDGGDAFVATVFARLLDKNAFISG